MLEWGSNLPRWLGALMGEKFFNACIIHKDSKKNEKNIFCLDCCESICPHCLSPHRSHRLLQIRRYVYRDVTRLGDAEKLMDCTLVQSYTINSAKVVFINKRPQRRSCRGSGNICITCDRGLQDPNIFCSLSCKLQHILSTDATRISDIIFNCEHLTLPELGLDSGQMTPDSTLEPPGSFRRIKTSSGSSGAGGIGGAGGIDCRTLGCTATTEVVVRKKCSNVSGFRPIFPPVCTPVSEISAGLLSRRKGTPQRSPLY